MASESACKGVGVQRPPEEHVPHHFLYFFHLIFVLSFPKNWCVKIGFISFCIIPFRFVSVNCVSIYFVSHRFRFVSVNFVSFRWISFCLVSFRFVSFWCISFRVSFRILQVPLFVPRYIYENVDIMLIRYMSNGDYYQCLYMSNGRLIIINVCTCLMEIIINVCTCLMEGWLLSMFVHV